jgi:hypothetical protein|nr:MAG: hypothetical protein [Lake Baikal virophage 1]
MSTFESELENKFLEKGIAPSSVKLYLNNLKKLNDGAEITSFKFLEKPEKIVEKLTKYKPTTKRNFLISIVSALNTDNNSKIKKLYGKYYDLMLNMNEEVKNIVHSADSLPEWKLIIGKLDELQKDVDTFKDNKTISPPEFETLLKLVVLSLYTLQPPRRNGDYLDMYIVEKFAPEMSNEKNYLSRSTGEFVFNAYKTAKKYNQQIEKITPDMVEVLRIYLKFHPLLKSGKLPKGVQEVKFLVYRDGEGVSQINAITRILNSVLGKGIASSKLRHIYLTSKYGDTVKEQEKDATAMGHSTAQQKDYIYA